MAYGLVVSLFAPAQVLAATAIPTSVPAEVQQAKSVKGNVVDEHNNLWPIPNTFLDKLQNAEEFGQNPGYDPYVRSN